MLCRLGNWLITCEYRAGNFWWVKCYTAIISQVRIWNITAPTSVKLQLKVVPMKKMELSRNKQCMAVKLYRDDVEEIVRIISSHYESVVISDEEYKYDSIEEFIEKRGTTPRYLGIKSKSHDVTLSISHRWLPGTHLWSSGDDKANTCFFAINEVLEKRRRLMTRLLVPAPLFVLSLVLFVISLTSNVAYRSALSNVALVVSFAANAGVLVRCGAFSSINLSRRHETTTFWSRNSEQWISGLVGALLGAGGMKLVEWLIKEMK